MIARHKSINQLINQSIFLFDAHISSETGGFVETRFISRREKPCEMLRDNGSYKFDGVKLQWMLQESTS